MKTLKDAHRCVWESDWPIDITIAACTLIFEQACGLFIDWLEAHEGIK